MTTSIYNQQGEKIGERELNPKIFGVKIKKEIVQQIVKAMLANKRAPWAHAKTKAEVRGGGRKPWKQKGTGRARAGSIRSPIWRGGGVIFGPNKERNYSQKINKKVKQKVILMCLSDKVKNNLLVVVDKLELSEIKTKKMIKIFNSLPVKNNKTLVALDKKDEIIIKSGRNIPAINFIAIDSLNILDILKNKYLLITQDGVDKLEKHFIHD